MQAQKLPESNIPRITLNQAVKEIKGYPYCAPKGWEFYKRENGESGKNLYFLPSQKLVERFKQIIGDKWNCTKTDKVSCDLRDTNITIGERYIYARGGLCPSGLRLFEIVDNESATEIRIRNMAEWKRSVYIGQLYNSWVLEKDGRVHNSRVREVGLKQTNCIAFRHEDFEKGDMNALSWLYWPKAKDVTFIHEEGQPTKIKVYNEVMDNFLVYQPMSEKKEN